MKRKLFIGIAAAVVIVVLYVGALVNGLIPVMGFSKASHAITHASSLVLYEGLPHPGYEPESYKRELETKDTVRLHDHAFYAQPIRPEDHDTGRLRTLCAASKNYAAYSGPKKCGGYHPDYALVWRGEDGTTLDLLVCFGCHEMKFYGPGVEGHVDITRRAFMEMRDTLNKHRRLRPEWEEQSLKR